MSRLGRSKLGICCMLSLHLLQAIPAGSNGKDIQDPIHKGRIHAPHGPLIYWSARAFLMPTSVKPRYHHLPQRRHSGQLWPFLMGFRRVYGDRTQIQLTGDSRCIRRSSLKIVCARTTSPTIPTNSRWTSFAGISASHGKCFCRCSGAAFLPPSPRVMEADRMVLLHS